MSRCSNLALPIRVTVNFNARHSTDKSSIERGSTTGVQLSSSSYRSVDELIRRDNSRHSSLSSKELNCKDTGNKVRNSTAIFFRRSKIHAVYIRYILYTTGEIQVLNCGIRRSRRGLLRQRIAEEGLSARFIAAAVRRHDGQVINLDPSETRARRLTRRPACPTTIGQRPVLF